MLIGLELSRRKKKNKHNFEHSLRVFIRNVGFSLNIYALSVYKLYTVIVNEIRKFKKQTK